MNSAEEKFEILSYYYSRLFSDYYIAFKYENYVAVLMPDYTFASLFLPRMRDDLWIFSKRLLEFKKGEKMKNVFIILNTKKKRIEIGYFDVKRKLFSNPLLAVKKFMKSVHLDY